MDLFNAYHYSPIYLTLTNDEQTVLHFKCSRRIYSCNECTIIFFPSSFVIDSSNVSLSLEIFYNRHGTRFKITSTEVTVKLQNSCKYMKLHNSRK